MMKTLPRRNDADRSQNKKGWRQSSNALGALSDFCIFTIAFCSFKRFAICASSWRVSSVFSSEFGARSSAYYSRKESRVAGAFVAVAIGFASVFNFSAYSAPRRNVDEEYWRGALVFEPNGNESISGGVKNGEKSKIDGYIGVIPSGSKVCEVSVDLPLTREIEFFWAIPKCDSGNGAQIVLAKTTLGSQKTASLFNNRTNFFDNWENREGNLIKNHAFARYSAKVNSGEAGLFPWGRRKIRNVSNEVDPELSGVSDFPALPEDLNLFQRLFVSQANKNDCFKNFHRECAKGSISSVPISPSSECGGEFGMLKRWHDAGANDSKMTNSQFSANAVFRRETEKLDKESNRNASERIIWVREDRPFLSWVRVVAECKDSDTLQFVLTYVEKDGNDEEIKLFRRVNLNFK